MRTGGQCQERVSGQEVGLGGRVDLRGSSLVTIGELW
jgi:hypothetical protein